MQVPVCPSCFFLLRGVIREPRLPPSAGNPPALLKGLHSAEASFLCTRHKQLFLLSLLLMVPGELADHFLLMDITPPRNDRLPPLVLLIMKRHFSLLPHYCYHQSWYGSTSLPRSAGAAGSLIPKEPREGTWHRQWKREIHLPQVCQSCSFSPVRGSIWLLCFPLPCYLPLSE